MHAPYGRFMPRKPRYLHPHGLTHAMLRGVDRNPVFRKQGDRYRFLETLAEVVPMFRWEVQAYCLMDNHVHLLVDARQPNLSAGLHRLAGLYAQWFNREHGRTGHLYEERFKAIPVKSPTHRLSLHAYIPLNPVSALLVDATRGLPVVELPGDGRPDHSSLVPLSRLGARLVRRRHAGDFAPPVRRLRWRVPRR